MRRPPPPAFPGQGVTLSILEAPAGCLALLPGLGRRWPVWVCRRPSPPPAFLPQGFLLHLGFYSRLLAGVGTSILTLYRFSSLNGPALCCHPAAPLSAAGRKCL